MKAWPDWYCTTEKGTQEQVMAQACLLYVSRPMVIESTDGISKLDSQ